MAAKQRQAEMPGYFTLLEDSFACFHKYFTEDYKNLTLADHYNGFYRDLKQHAEVSNEVILWAVGLAVTMTVMRWILNHSVFLV